MRNIHQRYVRETYDDQGLLETLSVECPPDFNFGYDVVDDIAENDPDRRALLRGVIATGNRNFGVIFALSGKVISDKCNVPVLYRFELAGNDLDISRITAGLQKFWGTECLTMA